MANVNRPNGFRPVKHRNGSPYTGQQTLYFSVNDNLAIGDLVEQEGTGVRRNGMIYPTCDRLDAADDTIVGVVVGFELNPTNLENLYHVSSSTIGVFIADARDLIMEAQSDDATMVLGDVGLNVSPTFGGLTESTGTSNMQIDGDTAGTTNSLILRIVGSSERVDNDTEDSIASQKWLVMINDHAGANLIAGV